MAEGRAFGGVDVQAVVLAGLASNELGAALELQLAGGVDGEAWSRSGTLIALELSGRG